MTETTHTLAEDLTPRRAAKAYVALAVSVVLAGAIVVLDVGDDGMTSMEWVLVLVAALNPILVWATNNET